jgi:hypothetical protein
MKKFASWEVKREARERGRRRRNARETAESLLRAFGLLLGETFFRTLDIAQEFAVHAFGKPQGNLLGFLDSVPVLLVAPVVRGGVAALGHEKKDGQNRRISIDAEGHDVR